MCASNAIREVERYGEQLLELLAEAPDEVLWQKPGALPNSIGALARHLAGNLNHYLGAGVLQNGYRREREQEFHAPPISRDALWARVRLARAASRPHCDPFCLPRWRGVLRFEIVERWLTMEAPTQE